MMEGDVEEGSTPLKDLFDQTAQGQTKVTIAQVKVLPPNLHLPQNLPVTLLLKLFDCAKSAAGQQQSACLEEMFWPVAWQARIMS